MYSKNSCLVHSRMLYNNKIIMIIIITIIWMFDFFFPEISAVTLFRLIIFPAFCPPASHYYERSACCTEVSG